MWANPQPCHLLHLGHQSTRWLHNHSDFRHLCGDVGAVEYSWRWRLHHQWFRRDFLSPEWKHHEFSTCCQREPFRSHFWAFSQYFVLATCCEYTKCAVEWQWQYFSDLQGGFLCPQWSIHIKHFNATSHDWCNHRQLHCHQQQRRRFDQQQWCFFRILAFIPHSFAIKPSNSQHTVKGVNKFENGGPNNDHEQGGQDTKHHRNSEFHWNHASLLLRPELPFCSQSIGVHTQ